jgi:hypothetical protein
MTMRIAVVRQVREVRERLRDAAAAEHAVAETESRTAAERAAGERRRLELVVSTASSQLEQATSVYDLERIALVVDSQEDAVAEAAADAAAALERAMASARELRERTRTLRTAEKAIEVIGRRRAMREARAEQRGADDLAGRRK